MILRKLPSQGSIVLVAPLLLTVLALLASFATAADSLTDLERASNQSLLWGPYRPNLYFGMRPRIPNSLSMGLLWARVEDYESVQNNFRYTCEQHEGMAGYGWEKYDPRHGGVQTIHDSGNQIDITTSFFKDTSAEAGDKGGNWGVRIKGTPRADARKDLRTTIVFNVNIDGPPGVYNNLEVANVADKSGPEGIEGDVFLVGETPELGSFKITVKDEGGEGIKNVHPVHGHITGQRKPLSRTFVNSKVVESDVVWQSKPLMFSMIKKQIDDWMAEFGQENMPPPFQIYTFQNEPGPGNVHFVQKVFQGEFEFDVLFSSGAAKNEIVPEDLTKGIAKIDEGFDKRFDAVFKPQAPFTAKKYTEFSKSLFSNLLGGIGYFHGDWKVDRTYAPEYEEENEGFWEEAASARARAGHSMEGPNELFTSIPSRPFFPRGFLWDEGFHLMPVVEWDADLTLQIIKSWFALMDEDGWIAREQILGAEARSKVPPEFQVQYPHYANPPTLFLTITKFIDRLVGGDAVPEGEYAPQLRDKGAAEGYLRELYPLLKKHYEWFRRSQRGDVTEYDRAATSTKEAYRWRGRTERHCLTSGLDDFPRAQPPHPGELHVDALAWVGLMSSSLHKIATYLGEEEESETFAKHLKAIKANAVDLHWSEQEGMFCDATIDEFEEHRHVCHQGYVSLMPFMLGLVEDDKKIASILKALADPEELWSAHGIRSLTKKSELYGTEENYWRSPVWVNMNYLILTRLYAIGTGATTGSSSGGSSQAKANAKEAARLYDELRQNLVDTVFRSWRFTGFAWEQYDPETGKGQRTQHFTGWTSLVVKIMGMKPLGKVESKVVEGGRDEL